MSYYWGMDFCLANSVFSGRLRKDFSSDSPSSEKQKSKVMKFHQILLGAVVFLTACSSPKYAYHFDQYDYNSGRKNNVHLSEKIVEISPLISEHQKFTPTASTTTDFRAQTKTQLNSVVISTETETLKEKFKAMSKSEQRDFKKDLKAYAKKISKGEEVKSVKAAKGFDTLSGLAILFGGAGIVLIALASISNIFWVL